MVKYGYAIGRIRSMEALMLSYSHLTRMVDAKDFESAYLVLNETCYSKRIAELSKPFDFTELLELEFEFTKKFILDMAPDSDIIKALIEKYSFPYPPEAEYIAKLKKIAREDQVPLFTKYVKALSSIQTAELDRNLEKKLDDDLIEIVKMAKYQAFGIEPLIGFWIAKEMEMKNIRLILTGKLLKASTKDIKERMRNSYV